MPNLRGELHNAASHVIVAEATKRLEGVGYSATEGLTLMERVRQEVNEKYRRRLQDIINCIVDHATFRHAASVEVYRYAPITTCEVERSFSRVRLMLTDLRQRLGQEQLEHFSVIGYNSNITEISTGDQEPTENEEENEEM